MTRRFAISHPSFAVTIAAASPAQRQDNSMKADSSGYIAVNGVNYWFEIHGKGEPLLLLHGGLFSTGMFGPTLAKLGEQRRVIGVDLHGHGRTSLGDRKTIDPVAIGRDLGIVIQKLGLKRVDVMGYSFGGAVALQFAFQYPELVRKLVLTSTLYAQSGFYPEMLPQQAAVGAAMAPAMKETPIYANYAAIAPHPEEFPRLLDAMGEYMRKEYDWSANVKKLQMPVMLVYADADMIRPEHIVSFFQLLGGGLRDAGWQREHMSKHRLAIIPDHTHYELGASPILADTVMRFLNASNGERC